MAELGTVLGLAGRAVVLTADQLVACQLALGVPNSPSASTQVSLLPPPWLELTTRRPLGQRDAGEPAGQHPHVRRRR